MPEPTVIDMYERLLAMQTEHKNDLMREMARQHELQQHALRAHHETVIELNAEIARLETKLAYSTVDIGDHVAFDDPEAISDTDSDPDLRPPPAPEPMHDPEPFPSDERERREARDPDVALLQVGEEAFHSFVGVWMTNWYPSEVGPDGKVLGPDGKPLTYDSAGQPIGLPAQPDRMSILLLTFTKTNRQVTAYIRACGGLAGAVQETLLRNRLVVDSEALKTAKKVAMEMSATASKLSIPLEKLLERSLYVDPDGPLRDGPAGGTVDFHTDRPKASDLTR